MYILFSIFIIILLFFFVINHSRKKCIIRKICCMTLEEKCNLLNAIIEPMGFSYLADQDIFTSTRDAWQRKMGYQSLYNRGAVHFNMVFDYLPVYFDYNDKTWMIQLWKGQYGVNTGGEIGVYYADHIVSQEQLDTTLFQAVDDSDILKMSMYLRRFYFIILVYANLKMEYDTKDKTFWKRKGNDMKVLLGAVNAKYIHSNLAVYCLKAYAEKYGDTSDEISIGEYTINQQLDEILRDIYKRKPDMLCLSCYIWNLTYVEEICREIKKVMPQIIIWIGGPEVSYDGVKVLERLPEVDGVMKGEGEQTFCDLLHFYQDKTADGLQNMKGIVYREQTGQIVENEWRKTMDLSKVPFVYENMGLFEHKIIYYETSRGCPFSCSYCLSSIDNLSQSSDCLHRTKCYDKCRNLSITDKYTIKKSDCCSKHQAKDNRNRNWHSFLKSQCKKYSNKSYDGSYRKIYPSCQNN